jgi:hypothetical protein
MNELKTLKDIFTKYYEDLPSENLKNDLRQEAIRHLKETDWSEVGDPYCCPYCVKGWIVKFFNITDEELAEGKK